MILIQTLAAAALGATPELEGVPREYTPLTYGQTVCVTFTSADACARAEASLAPLYDGHARAVTCRWDDNNEGNLEAAKRMAAHGVPGTFYLHGPGGSYHYQGDYLPLAKQLVGGPNSIGGHGLTHPYLAYINRNRMFEEVAGVRILWEAALDTPVHSYAFSFVNYRSEAEGDLVQRDIVRTLERAGFYHAASFTGFMDALPCELVFSPIMPPENTDLDTFKRAVDWAASDPKVGEQYPCVSNSMHAWYGSPLLPQYDWDELDRRLEYLAGVEDAWFCNQNQYAAYRWQRKHGGVEVTLRAGDTLVLRVRRPLLFLVNDPVPLTLALEGVSQDEVASVTCRNTKVERSARRLEGQALFHLHHGHDIEGEAYPVPVRIGHTDNADNHDTMTDADTDPDFPTLRALLHFDGERLRLDFENRDPDRAVDYLWWHLRLPIGFEKGVIRGNSGEPLMPGGSRLSGGARVTLDPAQDKAALGEAFFVAQFDFSLGGEPGRLYATCRYAFPDDASFPRDGFAVMGPIPPGAFDLDAFAAAVEARGAAPEDWTDGQGNWTPWRDNRRDGEVVQEHLDFEVVRTQGDWFKNLSPVYVLRSVVTSSVAREAVLYGVAEDFKAVFLNGAPLEDLRGTLRAGENELVVVHHPEIPPGNPRHSACFLRLTDADTGARLRDIAYAMPEVREVSATLTVALLQMLPFGDDQQKNLEKAVAYCRQAAEMGADIALLPEMFNIGYTGFHGTDDATIAAWAAQAVGPDSEYMTTLRGLARELDMAIGATCLEAWPGGPRNAVSLIDRHGEVRFTYGKVHTCDFAAFEAATTPGEDWYVETLDTKCGPVRVGAMICYDREFPESARTLMLKGAEVVLTPNACLLDDVRLHQFQTRAYENSLAVCMTNYAAPYHGGRSVAYGPGGEPLVEAPGEEGVYLAKIDLAALREHRRRSIWGNAFRRPHRYGALTEMEVAPVFERTDGFGRPFDRANR